MTQLILNIENARDVSLIKRLIAKMDGITIVKSERKRKTGLDEALEDVAAGRVSRYESVEDFFKEMGL